MLVSRLSRSLHRSSHLLSSQSASVRLFSSGPKDENVAPAAPAAPALPKAEVPEEDLRQMLATFRKRRQLFGTDLPLSKYEAMSEEQKLEWEQKWKPTGSIPRPNVNPRAILSKGPHTQGEGDSYVYTEFEDYNPYVQPVDPLRGPPPLKPGEADSLDSVKARPRFNSHTTWKDVHILCDSLNDSGLIKPRRYTKLSYKLQRKMKIAVKNARIMGLIPTVAQLKTEFRIPLSPNSFYSFKTSPRGRLEARMLQNMVAGVRYDGLDMGRNLRLSPAELEDLQRIDDAVSKQEGIIKELSGNQSPKDQALQAARRHMMGISEDSPATLTPRPEIVFHGLKAVKAIIGRVPKQNRFLEHKVAPKVNQLS